MDTSQRVEDLPCFKTNYEGDQPHYYDNDHDINGRSSSETDSDEEKEHAHKVKIIIVTFLCINRHLSVR